MATENAEYWIRVRRSDCIRVAHSLSAKAQMDSIETNARAEAFNKTMKLKSSNAHKTRRTRLDNRFIY